MTTKQIFITHRFGGGFATDFGPNADVIPNKAGQVTLPFLVNADNCIFEFDGGPHKAPGAAKLNSSALESGATIKGLFDYWITGTGGTSIQHRVIHVGAKIKKDDADGTFTDLFTGLDTDKVPGYAQLDDILVMASDSTSDVPKSWNGTTAQNLAGSPPNFSFATQHKNRMWAAGNSALAGRLYYSALLDPEDWIGAGSGSIDIDPDDGDRITAIVSHKNDLWVFKGPYKGTIHRITGSAPTGDDGFARIPFVTGIGAVSQNLIFRARDDIGFMWSDGTIHSLAATAAFGDFFEGALSRPINQYIRDHVNLSRLKHGWAANWPEFGYVLFGLPVDSSSDPNILLMMDYRFMSQSEPFPRWAPWSSFSTVAGAVASAIDGNKHILMSGGSDGFVRKLGQANRSIDGSTAISYRVTSPYLNYGTAIQVKTLNSAAVGIQPKSDGNITFGWARDNKAQQTEIISQGGSDVLAPASANQFTLGTSTLSGARFVDRFVDLPEGGEFRAIQYEASNAVNNEDAELHSMSAAITGGAWATTND